MDTETDMILATAPGRCGLVGNPTDMYGGSVVSCSTMERARASLSEDVERITLTVGGQTQTLETVADLELRDDYLNVARAVLKALEVDPATAPPFHLSADTDIPMQAGLAGSTAILACLVGCVLAHLELRLSPYQTTELVRKIEYDVLGIVCGFQDHTMATFGGVNFMDFQGRRSEAPQDGDTPFVTVEPLAPYVPVDLPLLLAHTGVRHHSGSVHKTPRERWLAGESVVVEGYEEVARLARRGKRALLECDWAGLASCMNRNHAIVRDLGGSGESNEKLIKAALDGGALGAKLAGAGGGGTILALTLDPDRTRRALLDAGADKLLVPVPSPGLTVETRL